MSLLLQRARQGPGDIGQSTGLGKRYCLGGYEDHMHGASASRRKCHRRGIGRAERTDDRTVLRFIRTPSRPIAAPFVVAISVHPNGRASILARSLISDRPLVQSASHSPRAAASPRLGVLETTKGGMPTSS